MKCRVARRVYTRTAWYAGALRGCQRGRNYGIHIMTAGLLYGRTYGWSVKQRNWNSYKWYPMTYTRWHEYEPDEGTATDTDDEGCVFVTEYGRYRYWNDEVCDRPGGYCFVCELEHLPFPSPGPTTVKPPAKRYVLVTKRMGHVHAAYTCTVMHKTAHLVAIRNAQEREALSAYLVKNAGRQLSCVSCFNKLT